MFSLEEYWERKSLILGDVNSGKTRMTLELLSRIIDQKRAEVAVLDLAPEQTRGIGGKMVVPSHHLISYSTTTIIAPRLAGRDTDEVEAYARRNAEAIEEVFGNYLKNPKKVVIINDVSLYLQTGTLDRLMEVLSLSHTAIINGYYGKTFGNSPLSKRERCQIDRLIKICDRVIYL